MLQCIVGGVVYHRYSVLRSEPWFWPLEMLWYRRASPAGGVSGVAYNPPVRIYPVYWGMYGLSDLRPTLLRLFSLLTVATSNA